MMDSPFFRSYGNRPRYSPAVRGIPVQRMPSTTSSPKVVSIPVHFVGSETTRSASAVKIQKVFRGFLVRKSVKRIASLRSEVAEVERRISRSETVDLIRRDPKERLRLNETLMALLLKLDSVRGVDSAVRECRKTVIKKAIALQEKLDAIVAAADQSLGTANVSESNDQLVGEVDDSVSLAGAVDQTLEIKDSAEGGVVSENAADHTQDKELAAKDSGNVSIERPVDCDYASDQTLKAEYHVPEVEDPANQLKDTNCSDNAVDETLEMAAESVPNSCETVAKDQGIEPAAEICEKMDITEVGVDSEVKTNEEPCVVKEVVENWNTIPSMSGCFEESVQTSSTENWSEYSVNPVSFIEEGEENTSEKLRDRMQAQRPDQTEADTKGCSGVGGRDDNESNRELLERMMEDNGKMMSLMTQLFEKNELQTRMLNSLTQRVEHLEKAFICDRLRRKKKRQAA